MPFISGANGRLQRRDPLRGRALDQPGSSISTCTPLNITGRSDLYGRRWRWLIATPNALSADLGGNTTGSGKVSLLPVFARAAAAHTPGG